MSRQQPHDQTAAFASRPWTHLTAQDLGESRHVPTMLSAEEQKLYYWLTAFWAKGRGATVDLGCFAGGSTARLAEGHRVAGRSGSVHAFDRFTANEDVKRRILYAQGVAPFDGKDILSLVQSLLAPWEERVVLHHGEIDEMTWDAGPIEVLVMDASKSAATGDTMGETFFPHLIEGASLVVAQDFLHWSQPWVPAQIEALAQCFRPLAHAERDTVVFLCEHCPDIETVRKARIDALGDSALDALLARAETRYAEWGLAPRLAETRHALAANPGKRRAFDFVRP